MKYRNLFLLTICLLLSIPAFAQKLIVERMAASPSDISASQYRRVNLAGEACALVKVQLAIANVSFEGNVIQPVEYKGGEYWVYMTKGSRELLIKHQTASPEFMPCHVYFADYGIPGVESLATYEMTTSVENTQKLFISYAPAVAMVIIDSKIYQDNSGKLELDLPVGVHNYLVALDGYKTVKGSVNLKGGTPQNINISLERTADQTIVAMNQQSPAIDQKKGKLTIIYAPRSAMVIVDTKVYRGNGHLELELLDGEHRYVIAQEKYDMAEGTVKLTDGSTKKLSVLLELLPESPDASGAVQAIPLSEQLLSPVIQNLVDNMVYIEGGTFMMGAAKEQGSDVTHDEKPAHQVTLSSFSLGKYEVTQDEWEAVMGSNPSKFKSARHPVETVSWNECQEFIRKLNAMTGYLFRLPTEAEWEFAARGGNKSKGYKYSGSNDLDQVAWYGYEKNSGKTTHDVGLKYPNELGLYDMSGNIKEWCQDWYSDYDSSSQSNPMGPASGSSRVCRGGSWNNGVLDCRVSTRSYRPGDGSNIFTGLRLAF